MFRDPTERERILVSEYLNTRQIELVMNLEDDLSQIKAQGDFWSEAWWVIFKAREENRNAQLGVEQCFGIPPKYVRSLRCLREVRKTATFSREEFLNLARLAKLDPVRQIHGLSKLLPYEPKTSRILLAAIIVHIGIREFFNLDRK